jgi:hypothetical protein
VAIWVIAVRPESLLAGFSLWQLPSQADSIGMSYVIQSPNGRVVVIDGGYIADASYLVSFLQGLGGNVDAWFLSHQHDDHIQALTTILPNLDADGITINKVYGSFLSDGWIQQYEPDSLAPSQALNAAMSSAGKSVTQPTLGENIAIDGMNFQILQIADPSRPTDNAINDQSMVIRLSTPGASVLFLGDLGSSGGERLLAGSYAAELTSEYVQMAHHGQNGVDQSVYAAIQPEYTLWPTPSWLWTWETTVGVRGWMDDLGVKKDYVAWRDGLVRLDLSATPEPGTGSLLCAGSLAMLLTHAWRRRKQQHLGIGCHGVRIEH